MFEGSKELLRLFGVLFEMYLNMILVGIKNVIINFYLFVVVI